MLAAMADIPSTEPAVFTAGDTLKFTRSLADYPASEGWVLSYTLVNADAKISFNKKLFQLLEGSVINISGKDGR